MEWRFYLITQANGAELCDSVSYQVCDHVQEAIFVQSPGEYP